MIAALCGQTVQVTASPRRPDDVDARAFYSADISPVARSSIHGAGEAITEVFFPERGYASMLAAGACREPGSSTTTKFANGLWTGPDWKLTSVTPSLDVNSTDCRVRLSSRSTLFQIRTELHVFFTALP